MRTLLWVALTAIVVALVSVVVCRWHEHRHTLKRVAVSYAEKYEDKTIGRKEDYEKVEECVEATCVEATQLAFSES
jgi:hypothetical protein